MIYRYGWDVRNRLQTVRTSTSINRTTNIYDPTGQRILTQTPTGVVTVYLGGLEIRFQGGSGGPRAAKHPVAGVTIGYDTIRSYTTHNHQQSIAHNTTPTSTTDSYYQPYGKMPIADTTTIIADRSYLNQITDTTTGLNYLNQRHYNASAGRFISVDALATLMVPSTLNPYVYTGGRPAIFSDDSGFCDPRIYICDPDNPGQPSSYVNPANVARRQALIDRQREAVQAEPTWTESSLNACYFDRTVCTRGRVENPSAAPIFNFISNQLSTFYSLGYLRTSADGQLEPANGSDFSAIAFRLAVAGDGAIAVGLFDRQQVGSLFPGCGFACAVATVTTGLFASGVGGAVCVASVALACGVGVAGAAAVTSVVYEATSRTDESGRDLVCAFAFGPSNAGANIISIVYSGGLTAATQGARAASRSLVADVGQDQVGSLLC